MSSVCVCTYSGSIENLEISGTLSLGHHVHQQRLILTKGRSQVMHSITWMNDSLSPQLLFYNCFQYFTQAQKYVFLFPSKAFVGVHNVLKHTRGPPAHWPDFLLLCCYGLSSCLLVELECFQRDFQRIKCLIGRDGPEWVQSSCSRRGCCWLWVCQGAFSGKLWVRESTSAS